MSSNASNEVFRYTGSETIPKDVTVVHIDCSVTAVEEHTFRECTTLASITIPSTVTHIGWEAFYNCSDLREVVLNEGLEKIGEGAFANCESLETITLPSTVTSIGLDAFGECTNLREVVFNERLNTIGNFAFSCCRSLQSVTLPSSLVEIGKGAFSKCSSLNEVVLNQGLETIGWRAFAECISLQSITLPSSLTEIAFMAFKDCNNLKEVVCMGLPMIYFDTFEGCRKLERITFPNLSSRLEDIIRAGQVDVQNKIQQYIIRGEIEWERGSTVCIPMDAEETRSRDEWNTLKQRFGQIVKWIKHYEMKEATTIFELALWKANIYQVDDDTTPFDRDACRIEVPGPVKDTIISYLDL